MAIFQTFGRNNQDQQGVKPVRVRSVLRYAFMPEILPRIRGLGMHFGHFAYLIALVFASARLLPQGHPVLNAANIGQYSVRQVIAMAANNITWDRNHIDQIAIFSAIVSGIIVIFIQAALIAVAVMFGHNPAEAQSFFIPDDGDYVKNVDVALIFLAQVFGSNLGLFDVATVDQPVPVSTAIQTVLGFYSLVTMVFALIIVVYYIMTVIGEAAKTGTPFGQRFNSLWAPIRLVLALGLLVPLGSGLNSAQYITLWSAEMGSNLATNVWSRFARGITETSDLISKPDSQSAIALVQSILAYETCKAAYEQAEPGQTIQILQQVGANGQAVLWNDPNTMAARAARAGMDEIRLVWTNRNINESIRGNRVSGWGKSCGEITVSLNEFDVYIDQPNALANSVGNTDPAVSVSSSPKYWWSDIWGPGSHELIGDVTKLLRQSYVQEIQRVVQEIRPIGGRIAEHEVSINATANYGQNAYLAGIETDLDRITRQTYQNLNGAIEVSFQTISGSGVDGNAVATEMVEKGWGAAGMWFSNIGRINQFYQENANVTFPMPSGQLSLENGDSWGITRAIVSWTQPVTGQIMGAVDYAYETYGRQLFLPNNDTEPGMYEDIQFSTTEYDDADSALGDIIIWFLGGNDLVIMRENPTLDPMANLMSAGSTVVTRSLVMLTIGAAGQAVGASESGVKKASKILGKVAIPAKLVNVALALAPLIYAIGLVGFLAGAMLFYVLPLIPFIYFAFAVMGWIMEIFEAIIAMPLWALSHLTIDGEGFSGQRAFGGYELIFMILLRPTLIIFGLIGGYVIFGACVYYLTSLFDMAIGVVRADQAQKSWFSGNDGVGAMGMLVYTVVYTFLVYNIALMCFKMVDSVPNNMLRWLGSGAQTFSDGRGDAIGGVYGVLGGTAAAASQIGGGMQQSRSTFQTLRDRPGQEYVQNLDTAIKEDDAKSRGIDTDSFK